jgi:hypothetical protein
LRETIGFRAVGIGALIDRVRKVELKKRRMVQVGVGTAKIGRVEVKMDKAVDWEA